MSGEAWLYLFAVLVNAVNLFLQVFFTIMYSDLEWYVFRPECGLLLTPSLSIRRKQISRTSRPPWPEEVANTSAC